jgi:hypothetical protein
MTAICSVNSFFVEPFHQGIDNLKAAFAGKRIEPLFQQTIANRQSPTEIQLSLLDRVSAALIGIILLIPLINTVAFAILRATQSSLVFQRSETGPLAPRYIAPSEPHEAPPPVDPRSMEELFRQRKNEGISLAPQIRIEREARLTQQEYSNRRTQALAALPRYPADGHLGLGCNNQVLRYDLDVVLNRFNPHHSLERFLELYNYAEFDAGKRERLSNSFDQYARGDLNPRALHVKHLLSKLFDFFDTNRILFAAGSEEEGLFKAQIRDTLEKILDAHQNCVDQVLGQLESIISDVIAEFEASRNDRGRTATDRFQDKIAFILFRLRSRLIQSICVAEYPDEHHMADMERLVKQSLAHMMGMGGGILDVGAQYGGMIVNADEKIEHIVNIFLFGEPSLARLAQDNAAGEIPNNVKRRRLESRYDPEKYLIEALRTFYGSERTARNDLLIWMRDHFDLGTESEETRQFVRAFSEVRDEVDIENGGNLTHQGLLYLLTEIGVFQSHNPQAAAE